MKTGMAMHQIRGPFALQSDRDQLLFCENKYERDVVVKCGTILGCIETATLKDNKKKVDVGSEFTNLEGEKPINNHQINNKNNNKSARTLKQEET